jgi:LETM1 and EF-hand domain-containing protein 1
MTKEQLSELAEALNILTAKSSIVKERRELQTLLEDNMLSEAVSYLKRKSYAQLTWQESKERPEETDPKAVAVSKRVRSMIKKIDGQLEKYDEKVGSSLNIIHTNAKGQISLKDLETAFRAIKHAPAEEMVEKLGEKLDVDKDGFVVSCFKLTF